MSFSHVIRFHSFPGQDDQGLGVGLGGPSRHFRSCGESGTPSEEEMYGERLGPPASEISVLREDGAIQE